MKFKVIGLLGPAGSGKDLVADWFVKEKNFIKVSFADPMKRFCQKTFGLTTKQLWGDSHHRNVPITVGSDWWLSAIGVLNDSSHEILSDVLPDASRVDGFLLLMEWFHSTRQQYPTSISPRVLLQTLGTEWGRKVDPLLWIHYGHEVVAKIARGDFYSKETGIRPRREGEDSAYFGAVIPDHRFTNEVSYTQEKGGKVIKLQRMGSHTTNVGIAGHASEQEQKTIEDHTLDLVLELPEGVDRVYEVLSLITKEDMWSTKEAPGASPSS